MSESVPSDSTSRSEAWTSLHLNALLNASMGFFGCALVTGMITVRLDPVHSTPEGSFRADTRLGVISALRGCLCWIDFQVPSVASKAVSPNQSVGQILWELAGFFQLSSRHVQLGSPKSEDPLALYPEAAESAPPVGVGLLP